MATRDNGTPTRTPGEMLTAHLLALLRGWSGYGYELAQRLEEAGLGTYNTGTIYRTLRHMEKLGLVSSMWDTSEDGPARRIYSMTGAGSLFLKNWIELLEAHQRTLERFMAASAPTGEAEGRSQGRPRRAPVRKKRSGRDRDVEEPREREEVRDQS